MRVLSLQTFNMTKQSFVDYSSSCDFPIENLPYGVFSTKDDVRFMKNFYLNWPHVREWCKDLVNNHVTLRRKHLVLGWLSVILYWIWRKPKMYLKDHCLRRKIMFSNRLMLMLLINVKYNCLMILKYIDLQTTLNDFMALGRPYWKEARQSLQSYLSIENNQHKNEG